MIFLVYILRQLQTLNSVPTVVNRLNFVMAVVAFNLHYSENMDPSLSEKRKGLTLLSSQGF